MMAWFVHGPLRETRFDRVPTQAEVDAVLRAQGEELERTAKEWESTATPEMRAIRDALRADVKRLTDEWAESATAGLRRRDIKMAMDGAFDLGAALARVRRFRDEQMRAATP